MYSVFFCIAANRHHLIGRRFCEGGYVLCLYPICILEIPGQPLEDDKCLNDKLKVFAI